MSREVIFRGKRVDNGEWVEGNLLIYGCESFISTGAVGKLDRYISSYICYSTFKVIPETVGQATGLYDSKRTKEWPKGQPIFEGDEVENQYKAKRIVKRLKYGEYRLFCGKTHSHFVNGWEKGISWKVIGNIHTKKA